MTYKEANHLLSMARDGQPVPEEVLAEALYMAGEGQIQRDAPCPDMAAFLADMRKAGLL